MKVLIAEDEAIVAELYKMHVKNLGHEVVAVANTGKVAVELTIQNQPDIVFLDINMDYKTSGIDACKSIKEHYPELKVYFLTAYSKDVFEKELKEVSYDGYINKMNFEYSFKEILSA